MSIVETMHAFINDLENTEPTTSLLTTFCRELKQACQSIEISTKSAKTPSSSTPSIADTKSASCCKEAGKESYIEESLPSEETAALIWFLLPQFLNGKGYDTVVEIVQVLIKAKLPRDILMMGIPHSNDVVPCGYNDEQCQMMNILLYEMNDILTDEELDNFDTDTVVSAIMTHAYYFISSTLDENERTIYKTVTKNLLVQLYMFGIEFKNNHLTPSESVSKRIVIPPVPAAGSTAQMVAISNTDIIYPTIRYIPHDKLKTFFS